MNKKIFIGLSLIAVLLTGCKSKQPQEVVNNDVDPLVNRSEQTVVLDGAATGTNSLSDISNENRIPTEEQVVAEDSVIKDAGDFTQSAVVDTSDWDPYLNEDFLFGVTFPRDYLIFEESTGVYLLSGEGVGDFYRISARENDDVQISGNLVRSNSVILNGLEFELEEYETEYGAINVSYRIEARGLVYRLTYEYYPGLEDMLDLFIKSAETFILF